MAVREVRAFASLGRQHDATDRMSTERTSKDGRHATANAGRALGPEQSNLPLQTEEMDAVAQAAAKPQHHDEHLCKLQGQGSLHFHHRRPAHHQVRLPRPRNCDVDRVAHGKHRGHVLGNAAAVELAQN